jgi:hypothetical protein
MQQRRLKGTTWWRALPVVAVLLMTGFGGCDADPMPSPSAPDRFKIFITASIFNPGNPLELVGLIGLKDAVTGPGVVVLKTPRTTVTATASAIGSFAGTIPGAPGDHILVSFRETMNGPESAPVDFVVPTYESTRAPPQPSTDPGDATVINIASLTATPPDSKGNSEIAGKSLGANVFVTLGNQRTGNVDDVQADKDGNLLTHVAAESGDMLVVIVRDPATGLTTPEATLAVPFP